MGMYKVVNEDNVPHFGSIAFLDSKSWNIENPYLRFKYKNVLVNSRPGFAWFNYTGYP